MASLIAARRGSITRILKPYFPFSSSAHAHAHACLFSSHTSRNCTNNNPSVPSPASPRASISPPTVAFGPSLGFGSISGPISLLGQKSSFSSSSSSAAHGGGGEEKDPSRKILSKEDEEKIRRADRVVIPTIVISVGALVWLFHDNVVAFCGSLVLLSVLFNLLP